MGAKSRDASALVPECVDQFAAFTTTPPAVSRRSERTSLEKSHCHSQRRSKGCTAATPGKPVSTRTHLGCTTRWTSARPESAPTSGVVSKASPTR